MKYILNETPVKTTNNFFINDLKIDLDIEEKELSNINVSSNITCIKEIKDNFNSKIGLSHSKYNLVKIDITNDIDININSNLETNYLVDEIDINLSNNTSSNINIRYDGNGFHNLKLKVCGKDNSNSNINLINNLDKESISLISFENNLEESSNITINFIDLGGKVRVSNYYSNLNNYSNNTFNNIHIGNNEDRIDMNYYMDINGINTNSYMEISGALFDNAYKTFKGTIDFKKGSSKSIGYENETSLLLSDKCISRSLPMMLCHEEDVSGTHSVSTGKIDENKLFYLMSRGLDEDNAKKLIMFSNFNKILNKIDNNEEIIILIEEKLNK